MKKSHHPTVPASFLLRVPLFACVLTAFIIFYIGHVANRHGFEMDFRTVSNKITESFFYETHMKIHAVHDASVTAAALALAQSNKAASTSASGANRKNSQSSNKSVQQLFQENTAVSNAFAHMTTVTWHPTKTVNIAAALMGTTAYGFSYNGEDDSGTVKGALTCETQRMCKAGHVRDQGLKIVAESKLPVVSEIITRDGVGSGKKEVLAASNNVTDDLKSTIYYPVFEWGVESEEKVIGAVSAEFKWGGFFNLSTFQGTGEGLRIVIENTCDQAYTYQVYNNALKLIGEGNIHDEEFDTMMVLSDYADFVKPGVEKALRTEDDDWFCGCEYRLRIYPSKEMRSVYTSSWPITFVLGAILAFLTLFLSFLAHDIYVARRHHNISKNLGRFNNIVASLFPAVVLDRVIEETTGSQSMSAAILPGSVMFDKKASAFSKHFLSDVTVPLDATALASAKPIYNSFPHTSIVFMDIVGFTAWSSERDPEQVFTLLESIYQGFDRVAKRLNVFKIETIGDCYVAVAGVPEPQEDHCFTMIRFAYECMVQNAHLTKALEASLGPGTADLTVRVGIHSGPVIAGVLRAEKVRFQLFGDTMNTASRMESTGTPGKIQISQDSADLLIAAGRADWLEQRKDVVAVKGKGNMSTYWVRLSKDGTSLPEIIPEAGIWGDEANLTQNVAKQASMTNKRQRLIDWNTEVLLDLLRKVIARRNAVQRKDVHHIPALAKAAKENCELHEYHNFVAKRSLVDHVAEVIPIKTYDGTIEDECFSSIILDPEVEAQARAYVIHCASKYNDIAFHNFDHASHVVMSANKLLGRIISPDRGGFEAPATNRMGGIQRSREFHDSTFGISCDPLMHFAIVQASMIHDMGHTGVSNKQLVKKKADVAIKYNGKSVAEQHSVYLAMDSFADPKFSEFRFALLAGDTEETQRYYQLLVSSVLATDIADRELQQIRQKRWDLAFRTNEKAKQSSKTLALDSFYLSELLSIDTHFRWMSGLVVFVYLSLVGIAYWATPSENIEILQGVEQQAASIAFTVLLCSYFGQILPHFLKKYKSGGGPVSGVVVGVMTIQTLALITDGLMAFGFRTPVLVDPMLGNRVHLLRWCEWAPLAFLIYFIVDGVDVPDRQVGLKSKYFFAGCQGLSTLSGFLFPFATNPVVWCMLLLFAVTCFLCLYPHLYYKRKVFRRLDRGISADDKEIYDRTKHALEFMEAVAVSWTIIVAAFFLEGFGPIITPLFNFTRAEGYGMIWTSLLDVVSKMKQMNHVLNIHTLVFDGGERAERQKKEESRLKHESNRKATILFEHIIQASDVAHTMQHWNIYQQWNRNLFEEMYNAYLVGDSDEDPRPGWYKGEIWFFENYIIPLAKKLDQCGVFGASGCEYLRYAVENRNEWKLKGREITATMIAECEARLLHHEQPEVGCEMAPVLKRKSDAGSIFSTSTTDTTMSAKSKKRASRLLQVLKLKRGKFASC